MAKTSKKLYGVKNDILAKSVKNIDVDSNEELLLLNAPSEFDEVYRTLGVNSKQDFVKAQLKDSREIGVFQDKYNNLEAFKGHHIKKLCNSHDLMILPISNIKGYLNDNTMKAIKEFSEEFKDTILRDSSIYILAKRECFYNDFIGKEVKTFVIFYKDRANDNGSSSRKLRKEDVINQIHSSGNDFSSLRIFNQLFLKKRYQGGDGMARLWSNLLLSFILMISISLALGGLPITATIFLTIYLVSMYFNNTVEEYKNCWNKFSERHNGYY